MFLFLYASAAFTSSALSVLALAPGPATRGMQRCESVGTYGLEASNQFGHCAVSVSGGNITPLPNKRFKPLTSFAGTG